MSRQLVPAALLAVVVLAGCLGGFASGPDAASTETPTAGAETLDPANADLPPGVNESGVRNASVLVTAHDRALRADGFVLNGTFVRNPPTTGAQTRRYRIVVGPDARRFSTVVRTTRHETGDADSPVVKRTGTRLWANETVTLRQTTANDQTVRTRLEDRAPSLSLTRAAQYESYLAIGQFAVDRVVARDGHTFTTLVATGTRDGVADSVEFDARLVADERGVIHEATVNIDDGPDGKTDHAEYRVVRVGASPQPPTWATNTTAG